MVSAVERVASSDPKPATLSLRAVAARQDREAWVTAVETLSTKRWLDGDGVAQAAATASSLLEKDLEPVVSRFGAHEDPAVRRLALSLLEAVVGAKGWSPERTGLLRRLRDDSSPWVAGAATLVWPPREDDPGFPR